MKYMLAAATLLVAAGPACADPLLLKPLADIRTRYENVEQDGVALQAGALTTRVRGGLHAGFGHWSAIVEAQGTLAAVGHFYDGLNGLPSARWWRTRRLSRFIAHNCSIARRG